MRRGTPLRFPPRRVALWILLLPVALALLLVRSSQVRELLSPPSPTPAGSEVSGWRTVVRVIDGDTLKIDGEETVRLIGIDAPETAHSPRAQVAGENDPFAVEATEFLRQLAEGQPVRLAYEERPQDRYGRTLAYVYLEDGTFVNGELVRRGYARAYRRDSVSLLETFIQLEAEAQAEGRGLWRGRQEILAEE